MEIQRIIDGLAAGENVSLKPGEYQGPLILNKPIVISGEHATIWAEAGPVIEVRSPGVKLRNLRVEVTGSQQASVASIALSVKEGCRPAVESVELQGTVLGMNEEAGSWDIPAVIDLGILPLNREACRRFDFNVPVKCAVDSDINGIRFNKTVLEPGANILEVTIEPMLKNSIIWGNIFLDSPNFTRRIRLTGMVGKDASIDRPGSYTLAVSWQSSAAVPARNPLEDVAEPGRIVQKGERVDLDSVISPSVPVIAALGWDSDMPFDIDATVFMLDGKEKVFGDQDLIYYNQPEFAGGGVRLKGAGEIDLEQAEIDLTKIGPDYQRISFCLSIYEYEKNLQTFSSVRGLYIRLLDSRNGKELLRYIPGSDFSLETAVVMAHLYRYKGHWRFAAVAAGFKDGLAGLCRLYGIETE